MEICFLHKTYFLDTPFEILPNACLLMYQLCLKNDALKVRLSQLRNPQYFCISLTISFPMHPFFTL